ncbi:MAG: translational GTPase TypA [Acidimicrobiales bacterium]
MLVPRTDIRNVAIVAHVDHGKTTLVDAMLWQSGSFRENEDVGERVLDSTDLEREKGITILAKQTAVHHRGVKVNIVDTPGHADFGGEVERALAMVDGALLLVDAAEGPLPQTRFVLRKALQASLPIVVLLNKMDRPDARPAEVLDSVYGLFIDNDADDGQIDFPVLYACGRDGWASTDPEAHGGDLAPLLDAILEHVPAPCWVEGAPMQALVTNLDASPYLGRLALCRVVAGTLERGQTVAWCRAGGGQETARIGELFVTEALDRVPAERAGPGELVAVSGLAEVTIGETLADPARPAALPPLRVDEPSLSITVGVNTSPLAGREGSKLTARLVKGRLDSELVGNVSIRVLPTERPDTWEVQGRGELALAVLIELMRREGFELSVGKPQVLTKTVDGVLCEPMERVEVDLPEEHLGALTQLLAGRRGQCRQVVNHGSGWLRMDWMVPARGLVGVRTEVLSQTRGTAVLHHAFDSWAPWAGDLRPRRTGSLVADRQGVTTTYALLNLEQRGTLLVTPGESVYEGMVVGESSRPDDMDVNPTKERKLTNVRSSTAEELVRLSPPRKLTLESALELIADDEEVEATPISVRVRKAALAANVRGRARSRARAASGG